MCLVANALSLRSGQTLHYRCALVGPGFSRSHISGVKKNCEDLTLQTSNTRLSSFDHVTPLLIELHWLPLRQRIVFKILLYNFKALNGVLPTYLTELTSPCVPGRALRFADQLLLELPTQKLKSIGLRAFSVCTPYLWDFLPFKIKSSASVPILTLSLRLIFFGQPIFRFLTFSLFRTFDFFDF